MNAITQRIRAAWNALAGKPPQPQYVIVQNISAPDRAAAAEACKRIQDDERIIQALIGPADPF